MPTREALAGPLIFVLTGSFTIILFTIIYNAADTKISSIFFTIALTSGLNMSVEHQTYREIIGLQRGKNKTKKIGLIIISVENQNSLIYSRRHRREI